MSLREKLEFVLHFAQDLNINTIRHGDLLNLREDLQRFIGVQEVSGESTFTRDTSSGTHAGLRKGQQAIYFPFKNARIVAVLEKKPGFAAIPIQDPYPWTYSP